MHFPKTIALAMGVLLPIVVAAAPASAAVQETFDFTLTGVAADGFGAGFSGSGTITATQSTGGAWIVDSATGSMTFGGGVLSGNITGLANFLGSDQLIFPSTSSLVDDHGISFALSDGQDVSIFNGGFAGVYDVESTNSFGTATFTLTAAVPETSTWAMLIVGFLGVGAFGYRRRVSKSNYQMLSI